MTDEELNRRFDGLMERITGLQEQMLQRFRSVEARLGSLETNTLSIVMLLRGFDRRSGRRGGD